MFSRESEGPKTDYILKPALLVLVSRGRSYRSGCRMTISFIDCFYPDGFDSKRNVEIAVFTNTCMYKRLYGIASRSANK